MLIIHILLVARFVFRFFKTQKKYNDGFIEVYLQPFYASEGRQLKEATKQKIKKYYCLGIPVTCASYKKIYGKELTNHERRLATLTGIVTPIIDDFTDDKTLDNISLHHLTSEPETYNAGTLEEKLVKQIICELIEHVPDPKAFLHTVSRTINAQHLSAKQLDPSVCEQELLNITLEKGAWSHILFHYLLDEIPSEEMVAIIGKMGGMLQMSNDIFDVYKDYHDGIKTIPNTCNDFNQLEKYYLSQCRAFCGSARQLPWRKKDLEFFITFIAFVMARGLVALQQLKQLQKTLGGGVLPIGDIERKLLICDMEKPLNAMLTIKYTMRIVKE